jgi:hypothetical protein
MASGIAEIRARMVDIIETATPDVDAWITYRGVPGARDIQEREDTGSPAQTTRGFQVVSLPIEEEGFLGGCSVDQHQRLRVILRYYVSDKPGAWDEANDRAASDAARIEERLLRPPTLENNWIGTPLIDIRFSGSVPLYQTTLTNVWFMSLDFTCLYRLDQDSFGGVFCGNYTTLTALKTALSGTSTGSTARLINSSTRELVGVWINAASGIRSFGDVNFLVAEDANFVDGTDIISQAGGSWAITYGTGIVVSTAAAEFYGYAELANSDILGTGTTTSYTRIESTTYTVLGDLTATSGSTDELRRLVDTAGALDTDYRWDNVSAWDALNVGGGAGLVTEHTTLAAIYGIAGPTNGDRALLKNSSDAEVGIWRYDGTQWLLEGELDWTAVGTDFATMFAGYVTTSNATATGTVSGLQITPTATGLPYPWVSIQTSSSTMAWDTTIRSVFSESQWSWDAGWTAYRAGTVGVGIGSSSAVTHASCGGVDQTSGANERIIALYGTLSSMSISVGISGALSTTLTTSASQWSNTTFQGQIVGRTDTDNKNSIVTPSPLGSVSGTSGGYAGWMTFLCRNDGALSGYTVTRSMQTYRKAQP